jgi:hypothetical protein
MAIDQIEELLMRILGLSEGEGALPAELATARERLRELLAQDNPSFEDIAAYASGSLNEDQQRDFEERISSSQEVIQEAESARNFLARVAASTKTAPVELVEAVIGAARDGGDQKTSDLLQAIRARWTMTREQMQRLFAEPKLRESLRRALAWPAAGSVARLPALAAAASDTQVEDRAFPGGRVRSRRVREHELEVLFTFEDAGAAPRALWLEGGSGEMWLEPLPPPGSDGEIFLVKDLDDPPHELFARLLRDPATIGGFLP